VQVGFDDNHHVAERRHELVALRKVAGPRRRPELEHRQQAATLEDRREQLRVSRGIELIDARPEHGAGASADR
jgi:hypothetical protein